MSLGSSGLPFSEQGGIERSCSLGTGVHFGAYTLGKNNTVHVSSFLKSCHSRKLFSCLWLLACSMWPFNKDLCFDSRVSHQRTQPRGTGVLTVNMSLYENCQWGQRPWPVSGATWSGGCCVEASQVGTA